MDREGRLLLLFVDDQRQSQESFRLYMEKNYRVSVVCASSAKDALDILHRRDFDAVVCDSEMPGGSGVDLLRSMRSRGDDRPFILFAGKSRDGVIEEALNAGASGYVRNEGDLSTVFSELYHLVLNSVNARRKEQELLRTKERLESLIENSFDAVMLFDLNGRVLSANPAATSIYGWRKEEMIGSVLPMVPEEEKSTVLRYFREVADKRKAMGYSGVRIGREGKRMVMNMSVSPVQDEEGNVVAIAGIGRDVTAISEALSKLAFREEEMRIMISSLSECVIVTDMMGRITLFNNAASKFTGYSVDEAIGRDVGEILKLVDEKAGHSFSASSVISSKSTYRFALGTTLLSRDGVERPVDGSASPVTDQLGQVRGVAIVLNDATERRSERRRLLIEGAINRVFAENVELRRMVNGIAEVISRELRAFAAEILFLDSGGEFLESVGLHCVTEAEHIFNRDKTKIRVIENRLYSRMLSESFLRGMDASEFRSLNSNVLSSMGLEGVIVPLLHRERPLGALLILLKSELAADSGLMKDLHSVAEQIAVLVSDARQKSELAVKDAVMRDMSDALLIALERDGELSPVYCNPSMEELLAMGKKTLSESTFSSLISDMFGEKTLEAMLRNVEDGTTKFYEVLRLNWSPHEMNFVVSFFPVDKFGYRYWVLMLKDVTEIMQTLEMLQKNSQKMRLIYSVVRHDLLNTLQAMQTYLQLYSRSQIDNDVVARLREATDAIKDELLSMAERESSGPPRWFNLRKIFETSDGGRFGSVSIQYRGPEVEILADPLIGRVFNNLITNSLKHGKGLSSISLSVQKRNDGLLIIYEDDGKGIPDDMKSILFDQIGERKTHGLRFVKDILEITGMSIRECGTYGVGAKFEIHVKEGNFKLLLS